MKKKPDLEESITFFMLLFITIGCLASCVSTAKQRGRANTFYAEHPAELAQKCADAFPVRDSAGQPVIEYTPADNTNYSGQIDSLVDAVNQLSAYNDALVTQLHGQNNNDSVGACRIALAKYQANLAVLQNKLSALQAAYKPCNPDTASITLPIYQENTARVTALNMHADSLLLTNNQLNTSLIASKTNGNRLLVWTICLLLICLAELVALIKLYFK